MLDITLNTLWPFRVMKMHLQIQWSHRQSEGVMVKRMETVIPFLLCFDFMFTENVSLCSSPSVWTYFCIFLKIFFFPFWWWLWIGKGSKQLPKSYRDEDHYIDAIPSNRVSRLPPLLVHYQYFFSLILMVSPPKLESDLFYLSASALIRRSAPLS
jgi:hypothetical protein